MNRPPVCHYFQAGNCRNGDLCPFAHPTVKCRQFKSTGWCPYGYHCNFLHGVQKHSPPAFQGDRKPCLFFANGQCKYGDRCTFSHNVQWEPGSVRTLDEYKMSKRLSKMTLKNNRASPPGIIRKNISSSSSDLRSHSTPGHEDTPTQHRPPISRPGAHSGGTNNSEICRLQQSEISRLLKVFDSEKLQEGNSSGDGRIFFLRFSSTDPDWAYDVREIVLCIHIVRMYPVEPLKITVLPKDYLPNTLVEYLNISINSWIDSKHKQVRQTNRTEIYLRPFLHWLDRNLENLFTEGLRKYKKQLFGDEPSAEQKTSLIEEKASSSVTAAVKQTVTQLAESDDNDGPQQSDKDADIDSEVEVKTTSNHSDSDDDQSKSEGGSDNSSTVSSPVDPFEDAVGEWVEPVPPEPSPPEPDFSVDHDLLAHLIKPSPDNDSTGRTASQQLCLSDFRLFGKAGTAIQRRLTVSMHCTRCRFQFTWLFSVRYNPAPGTESTGTPEQLRSVPPHSANCARCHQPMALHFHAVLLHPFTNVSGSLILDGCVADDVPPKLSQFLLTCMECNKIVKLTGVESGQRITKRCTVCHSLVGLEFSGFRLEAVKGLKASAVHSLTKTAFAETSKPPRKIRRAINKAEAQFIQDGQPLPDFGTCKHYRKSNRWLRFPCCGRAEPCDVCHDANAADGHEMEFATRMICGFCAKEQPFSNTKPCVRCGKQLSGSRSAHWEGGKGCRNKVTMSRKDAKKYSQQNKTVPRSQSKV